MNDKPAGWYYVGDAKLRYRDDYGWTEFYMDTSDPRAREWPPPAPRTLTQELSQMAASGRKHIRRPLLTALLARGRRLG